VGHIRWYESRYEIAKFALPLIKQFQISRSTYPDIIYQELGDHKLASKRWGVILAHIEAGLQSLVDSNLDITEEELDERQQNLELFGKWFVHLWD